MGLDHIFQRAKEGQDNENNFQLLYGYCNKKKGNKYPESVKMS